MVLVDNPSSQPVFTCSKSVMETLEQCMKYAQS